MKILAINPNTTDSMTRAIEESARAAAAGSTSIHAISAPWGPRSIEANVEEVLAAAAVVEAVAERREDYDGFVIACYGDPGLNACREVTAAPVVGIAEASMLMACMVAHRFSVVTVVPRIVPMLEDLVHRYGLTGRCASVRASGVPVLEIERDLDNAGEAVLAEARAAIETDGAEAIALGCAGMASLTHWLRGRLPGVPVIDGVAAAVKMCEALDGCGIRTAKVGSYADPEPKELVNCSPALQDLMRPSTATESSRQS